MILFSLLHVKIEIDKLSCVNCCGTVKCLAGILQPNGGKVKETEALK